MSESFQEALFGNEEADDVSENSITDKINTSDDLLFIVMRFFVTLVTGLIILLIVGKLASSSNHLGNFL